MMPDHAGNRGAVPSARRLMITCLSAMTDRDEQFVIIQLQSAHNDAPMSIIQNFRVGARPGLSATS
jgi:hypothetical protein